jgi:hypothetical protein
MKDQTMGALVKAVAVATWIALAQGCVSGETQRELSSPEGVREFENVGKLTFSFADDVGSQEAGVSTLVFAELASSEIVAPVMLVKRPRLVLRYSLILG